MSARPERPVRRLPGWRPCEWVALALLLAGAAWLRLAGLEAWLLSWDDLWHLMDAEQPTFAAVLDRNLHHQIHGPLAYVLRHALLAATHDPLLLRTTSLVPGLLLVPVFHALGRTLLGRGAGIFLAAVAAFADALVVLSQVLRAYALELLLVSLALLALAHAERRPGRRALAAYAGAATLAAWTHVSALVPLAGVVAVGTWRLRARPRALAAWLLGHAALLLPPAAWSAAQLHLVLERGASPAADLSGFLEHFDFLQTFFPASPFDALARLADTYRAFVFGPEAPRAAAAILGVPAALGLALLARRGPRAWGALCALVPALGMAAGLLGVYPFDASRHCLYALPFLLLPAAAAVQWLVERIDGRLVAAAGAAALAFGVDPDPEHYRRPRADFDTRRADLERTLAFLEERAGPRDVVLVNRVGMQILNLYERLHGEALEHVDHDPAHEAYPYDRWVLPGGEEHRFRGLHVFACDGPHEWSSYFGMPRMLRRCVEPILERRGADRVARLWILVPMRGPFLVFTSPRPLVAARAQPPDVRNLLHALRRVPFWELFFSGGGERWRAPTAGAVALPFDALLREWERLGDPPSADAARATRRARRRGPSRSAPPSPR